MLLSKERRSSLLALFIAFLMALTAWYMVSRRDRVEIQVDVTLAYHGLPDNLIITDGLANKLMVRLRGPAALLQSISPALLTRSVDLSGVKRGVNFLPLVRDSFKAQFRAFEILQIYPQRLMLKAENVLERTVPVALKWETPLHGKVLQGGNVTVTPELVSIRGAESIVSSLDSIPVSIYLDPEKAGQAIRQDIPLEVPPLVLARPASIRVDYTITSGRKTLSRTFPIRLEGVKSELYSIAPEKVTVELEVPEALAEDRKYLNSLEVFVLPPPLDAGKDVFVPLHFRAPEGMRVLEPGARSVQVQRKDE